MSWRNLGRIGPNIEKGRGDGMISKSIGTSDSVKGSFGISDAKCATILEDR
jgi:hypothetical protein